MVFVDRALAKRFELTHAWRSICYAEAQRTLHPTSNAMNEPIAGGCAIYAGDASPLNRAVGIGMAGPVTAADLDHLEALYREKNAPPRLELCPLADESLLDALRPRAYHVDEYHMVLVRPLDKAAGVAPVPLGVRIAPAAPSDADLWIRTVAQGFDASSEPDASTIGIAAPNFYASNATCYLAWVDGVPTGGGAMYIHEGVAEFGGASTRPEFRRHGIQSALLRARLQSARERGCEFAIVLTNPGTDSQRNVERAGFRPAYTNVTLTAA
jgi:GNAT superfamily N-acetyltransferase